MRHLLLTLTLLLASAAAEAQLVNPTQVQFESPDHALAVAYDLGYYLTGAASPVQTVRVPVAQVSGAGTYSILLSKPLLGANLTLKARVVAVAADKTEITSEWSESTLPFSFAPLAPSGLVVRSPGGGAGSPGS